MLGNCTNCAGFPRPPRGKAARVPRSARCRAQQEKQSAKGVAASRVSRSSNLRLLGVSRSEHGNTQEHCQDNSSRYAAASADHGNRYFHAVASASSCLLSASASNKRSPNPARSMLSRIAPNMTACNVSLAATRSNGLPVPVRYRTST